MNTYEKLYNLLTESRKLSDYEKTLTPAELVAHNIRMRGGEEAVKRRQLGRYIHHKTKNKPTPENLANQKAAAEATNKPGGRAFENRKKRAADEKASIKAAIELQKRKQGEGATGTEDPGPQ
jgi:hypothetical protein